MTLDFRLNERRRGPDRRQSVVAPEQLEARLLLSTNSIAGAGFPMLSSLASGDPVALSRSSTATSSADSANSFTISGTSAVLSIQGITSTTSTALTYTWTTTQSPVGGTISYSKNSSTQAREITLTFTRAGSYVTRVSILSGSTVVSTLTLQLSVVQLPSRVGLVDGLNKPVNSGSVIPVTTAPPQLTAVVYDQFSQPLLTQPEIAWSLAVVPAGGSATLTTTGNTVVTAVSKAGTYTLKASAGSQIATVSLNVSQVVSSITLSTPSGTPVDSSLILVTNTTNQNVLVKSFDQFGNAMTSLPAITWSTVSAPGGGIASVKISSGAATATFTRAGLYAIKGVVGSQVFTFQVSAEATLSRISVRTPDNREVSSGGTVAASGTSCQLNAIGLDQFAQPMVSQPEITWQVIASVTGGTATLTTEGSRVLAAVTKAGAYSLRAVSGSILSNVTVSVSQTLTSRTVSAPDGGAVDPSVPVVTRTTSQNITVKTFDQFGNAMLSAPAVTWTTLSAPVGGAASVKFSSGVATTTLTRAGVYGIKGVTGSQVFTFQINAEATLSRISVRTPENREVLSGGTVTFSGTSYQLNAIGLDQFSQPLISAPEISWQTVTAVTGGTATLTADGNKVLTTVTKAGSYSLRAVSGAIFSNVTLSVSQVLTSLSVSTPEGGIVDPSVSIVTRTTSLVIPVRALDQFGNAMSSLPTITWTTLSAPSGGTASVRFSSGVATTTLTRAGVYGIKGIAGNQSVTFQISAEATLARISVRTPENREVLSGGTVTFSGTSYQLDAIGLDQFSQPLVSAPEITWQVVSAVAGGTATLANDGSKVLATVNKAGSYSLRATSGSFLSNVNLSAAQVLASLTASTSDGNAIDPSIPVVTKTTSQAVAIKALDQFGNAMTTFPSITWSTTSAPSGGTATTRLSSGVATVTLTRAGVYGIKGISGSQSITFQISAEATLTRISVRTPENREVLSGGTVTFSGTSYQLDAIGLDQFSQPLPSVPEITWETVSVVAGGTATLAADGNKVLATVDKAGAYSLRATSGSVLSNVNLSVGQVLTTFRLAAPGGDIFDPSVLVSVSTTTSRVAVQSLDQFGNPLTTTPSISWSTLQAPTGGTTTTVISSGIATVTFNRSGDYVVRATSGAFTAMAGFQVIPTLQTIAAFGSDGRPLSTSAITVGATSIVVTLTGFDQFRMALAEQPEFAWSEVTTPAGGTAAFSNAGSNHTITFSQAGGYTLRTTTQSLSMNLNFSVVQTLTNISLTPGNLTITYGVTQQFRANALDQFEMPLTIQPAFQWSATGGTVSTSGVYTAGTQAGLYSISARAGSLTATLPITVIAPTPPDGLLDPDLSVLVNGCYGDGLIDRPDMISILRSVGVDGMVSATELADLRFLVSSTTPYTIPGYVRGLATDVVNASPANLWYKGQAAGNLVAGSSSTLLDNLIDKWFLGADEPALTTPLLTYQTTTGNLFNGVPSRTDARQGALGDCYFIAAVSTIADVNPDAVRNMFVDNGDGTYTVRFYSVQDGLPDYVTVNRRLPAQYNGALGYSGYGLSVSSPSTTVWIALAEKAYAQWNETGNEGRDGTNRYAAIEGGWMGYVNAQVLGTASSNYSLASVNKQTLVTALNSQKAVTIGTNSMAGAGLYGSHAYLVTGYDTSTDTFRLYNPWGFSHPGALSYAQLQAYCSMFVVADASGSSPISGSVAATTWHSGFTVPRRFSRRLEGSLSLSNDDGVSMEQHRYQPIGRAVAESTADSEFRTDVIARRALTRLRTHFMDQLVPSDLWNAILPPDHLTEQEFDLIDQLFAEQLDPVGA